MNKDNIFKKSDALAEELLRVINLPLIDTSPRIQISDVSCSLALEHWHSVRVLLGSNLLPSATVVHRAQFEAITRSIWLAYSAPDIQIIKLNTPLTFESEQAAKNMPQLLEMMQDLAKSAPKPAYETLLRFKENSWKALNSYAHAGIHPIRRHHEGYPIQLAHDLLRNANGLAIISCMQSVVLSGVQPLQKQVLSIANNFSSCVPLHYET